MTNPDLSPTEAALVMMSLITGEEWDEAKLADSAETLRTTAKAVLVTRGGMTSADADKVIAERWARYVAPIELPPDPEPIVGLAVDPQPPTPGEIKSRLDGYMNRTGRKAQESA